MDQVRIWKKLSFMAMMAILAVQSPAGAMVSNYQYYFPRVSMPWTGYIPFLIFNQTQTPSPTPIPPTPTPTNTPLPPGTPPPYSTSYYMLTVNGTTLYNFGCQLGTVERNLPGSRDMLVILDFGSPKLINNEYGTDLFWMGPVTISQIKAAVMNFGRGYYVCAATDRGSQIYVGVGTTNYGSIISSTSSSRAHGIAWAQMINEINSWFITNGFSGQVHAVGANDIELAWNSATTSRAWVDGYDSINQYDYYDFGTADGCATRADPTRTTCGNGWTREDVWYKAYGTRPGFPVPEIYNTRGANAEQWALISLYSVNYKGYKIEFYGVLTQYQACLQSPGQCTGVDNDPATGWLQLYNELKRDVRTFYTPRWSSDMKWGHTLPSAFAAQRLPATATPVVSSLKTMPQQIADTYPSLLARSDLNAQMKGSLQEKLIDARRLLADRAAGEAHPASKDPAQAPKAPSIGDSGFPVGIFDGGGGIMHSWEGTLSNHWQDSIGSDFMIVSAGALANDPSQGLVMVMRVSGNRLNFERKIVLTPQKAGSVRISSAQGTLLTLTAENGTRFSFDAARMAFK